MVTSRQDQRLRGRTAPCTRCGGLAFWVTIPASRWAHQDTTEDGHEAEVDDSRWL